MDNHISSICRYCLDEREEFQHLALDCPALWWERHTINAQDPHHSTPETWTPQQILDFSMLPKINDAFATPLHTIDMRPQHLAAATSQMDNATPDDPTRMSESDESFMEVSSETASSSESEKSEDSFISID